MWLPGPSHKSTVFRGFCRRISCSKSRVSPHKTNEWCHTRTEVNWRLHGSNRCTIDRLHPQVSLLYFHRFTSAVAHPWLGGLEEEYRGGHCRTVLPPQKKSRGGPWSSAPTKHTPMPWWPQRSARGKSSGTKPEGGPEESGEVSEAEPREVSVREFEAESEQDTGRLGAGLWRGLGTEHRLFDKHIRHAFEKYYLFFDRDGI